MMRIIILFIGISFANCATSRTEIKNIIDHIFNKYDHRILPEVKHPYNELESKGILFDFQNGQRSEEIVDKRIASNSRAIVDTINIYLRYIDNIDIVKQTFETQLTFRQSWKDERLAYNDHSGAIKQISLNPEIKIWKPDLFISNEIEARFHDILEPNSLARIYSNGSVLYSVRITLKTICPMDFKYFPFDQQICSISFATYGHTTDDIILNWKEGDPIQVSRRIHNSFINHMKLMKVKTGHCTARTNTGEYSCLKIDFQFDRNSKFYICRWFLSSFSCVLIVWLSFWLSAKHSKGRLGLLIASTLMLTCVTTDIKKSKPELDYCTTIDIWSMACWLLVIVGYIQLGLVQYFTQKEEENDSKENGHKQEDCKETLISENKLELFRQKWLKKSRMSKLDFASIVLFPIAFILIELIMLLSHRLL